MNDLKTGYECHQRWVLELGISALILTVFAMVYPYFLLAAGSAFEPGKAVVLLAIASTSPVVLICSPISLFRSRADESQ